MALISKKKKPYPISEGFHAYLKKFDREVSTPIHYPDLLRYQNSIPLYDSRDNDTLWETVYYSQGDMAEIYAALLQIYVIMKAGGREDLMKHLSVDRVDLCVYGNTQPFRVRIVNKINDNFDYFYIKHADASRVYGLELEALLSPNYISYIVSDTSLIEEHIVGIPGDQFIKQYLNSPTLNEIRLAKEFVKFNERCFVRLLGDMHSSNFVVDITPDFEEVTYRLRALDFDQQSYEGRRAVYLPQYFKQNNPIIEVGERNMEHATMKQYQQEERTLIATRIRSFSRQLRELLHCMRQDRLAPQEHVEQLRKELAKHYKNDTFLGCQSMGAIVEQSLRECYGGPF